MSIAISLYNPDFNTHDEAFLDKFVTPTISHDALASHHLHKVRQTVTDILIQDKDGKRNFNLNYSVGDRNTSSSHSIVCEEYQLTPAHEVKPVLSVYNVNIAYAEHVRAKIKAGLTPTSFPTLFNQLYETKNDAVIFLCHQLYALARSFGEDSHYQLEASSTHAVLTLHGGHAFQYRVSTIAVLSLERN